MCRRVLVNVRCVLRFNLTPEFQEFLLVTRIKRNRFVDCCQVLREGIHVVGSVGRQGGRPSVVVYAPSWKVNGGGSRNRCWADIRNRYRADRNQRLRLHEECDRQWNINSGCGRNPFSMALEAFIAHGRYHRVQNSTLSPVCPAFVHVTQQLTFCF